MFLILPLTCYEMFRKGLSGKMTFELRPEWCKEASPTKIDPLKPTGAKKAVQIGIFHWTFVDIDERAFSPPFGVRWT